MGNHTSGRAARLTPKNSRDVTPTITAGAVPIVIRWPITAGSPLKRDRQNDQLTTATGSAPA